MSVIGPYRTNEETLNSGELACPKCLGPLSFTDRKERNYHGSAGAQDVWLATCPDCGWSERTGYSSAIVFLTPRNVPKGALYVTDGIRYFNHNQKRVLDNTGNTKPYSTYHHICHECLGYMESRGSCKTGYNFTCHDCNIFVGNPTNEVYEPVAKGCLWVTDGEAL